jgi:Phage gp6-like head-tail connector protein
VAIITLAEAKLHLRITGSADDTQIQAHVDAATDLCEQVTSSVWTARSVTESYDGLMTISLSLRTTPVLSITTVTENGVAVPGTGYTLDANSGILYRGSSLAPMLWQSGRQNITVVYQAGPSGAPPARIKQGTLEVVAHLWGRQRGGSNLPRQEELGPSPWGLPLSVTNSYGTGLWDYGLGGVGV